MQKHLVGDVHVTAGMLQTLLLHLAHSLFHTGLQQKKNSLAEIILRTRLSGGVSGLRLKTDPKTEDVIRYRRAENHSEECLCSRVLLSISWILSRLTFNVSLKATILVARA